MERNTRKCSKPKKIEEMTKEQIREAIIKKRECNAKAQTIVESLLEKCIRKSYFVECLPYINQSHFDDIIEERSITCLCGYPMCQNYLSQKDIPTQKYRISVKTNKVYDITARKKFCSNECYNSAMHVKKQMLTSPLWFREYENIPKFHLLELDSVGRLGETVDVSIIEKIKLSEKPLFTSINDFAGASLKDITDKHKNDKVNVNLGNSQYKENMQEQSKISSDDCNKKCTDHQLFVTSPVDTTSADVRNSKKDTLDVKESNNKNNFNAMNIVGDIVEKTSNEIDPILVNESEKVNELETVSIRTSIKKKKPAVTIIAIKVEKSLAEWFTLDTMLFIFGEEKVKQMITDKGECLKEYLNNFSKSTFYNSNTYDQYQELCRKLNLLEMEDRKYDAQVMQRERKPLPDYSTLKEESKNMQLKVSSFLAGDLEIPLTNTNEVMVTKVDDTKCENLTVLPPVDKSAQNALRRRIVCDHLNKMLPDLLRSLGLLTLSISSDVRLLVNTFKLKANNIMFKPIQWTLIAIVIIKLLSFRNKQLEYLLEQPKAYQHMQLLLLSYKQDGGYLDRLISWLTDVDRLLDSNDTHLTVG